MVEGVRTAEQALGTIHYGLSTKDVASRLFRRSLYVIQDIKAGDRLTELNVRSIRPGNGLAPRFSNIVLGRHATINLPKGTPLEWAHLR